MAVLACHYSNSANMYFVTWIGRKYQNKRSELMKGERTSKLPLGFWKETCRSAKGITFVE